MHSIHAARESEREPHSHSFAVCSAAHHIAPHWVLVIFIVHSSALCLRIHISMYVRRREGTCMFAFSTGSAVGVHPWVDWRFEGS
mmetsp:Transcript_44057/g.124680  ORF Transcript_44057/g.124680 Transcript_44057/m.124680 type:complete len:85 (+) Transcript_44057:721-975(+)